MNLGLYKNLTFNSGKVYPYATGGDYVYLYEEGNKTYRVHVFLTSGTNTLNVEVGGKMNIFLIGGGGGGGHAGIGSSGMYSNSFVWAGGGGGGGVLELEPYSALSSQTLTFEIGAGGTGGVNGYRGDNGGNTTFNGLTAYGGGGGGGGRSNNFSGNNGGAGGGASVYGCCVISVSGSQNGGSGVSGQGYGGGLATGNNGYGGGGGGAGSSGNANNVASNKGVGGSARVIYGLGFGGGGGAGAEAGGGGAAGGENAGRGASSRTPGYNATNGVDGYGGGGGGGAFYNSGNGFLPGNGGNGGVVVAYVVAEKKLWTPSELTTLAAWYDASDVSGLNNNDPITTWTDKSGNNNDVSNTNTNRPTYKTNILNGNSVLEFDGSNDYLQRDSSFLVNLGQSTIAWIARGFDTPALPRVLVGESSSTTTTPVLQAVRLYGATYEWTFRTDASVIYNYDTTSASLNTWSINLQEDTLSALNYAKNGTSYTQAGTYTRTTTTVNRFSIGCDLRNNGLGNPGAFFYGQVGEIIIIDGNLSLEEKQKLEGYLAHKWGLTNNLPSGHPYKYEPPYKVEPEEIVTDGLVLNLDAGDYASYPRSGTTWYDISGNGNNSTLNGTYTFDIDEGSIEFSNSSSAPASNVSFIKTASISNMRTFSFWFYRNAISGSFWRYLLDGRPSVNNSWIISGGIGSFWTGSLLYVNGISQTFSWANIEPSSLNEWRNVTIISPSSLSTALYIFSRYTGDEGFSGTLGKVLIYNRALSSTEITQNFNALRGRYGI